MDTYDGLHGPFERARHSLAWMLLGGFGMAYSALMGAIMVAGIVKHVHPLLGVSMGIAAALGGAINWVFSYAILCEMKAMRVKYYLATGRKS